MELRHLRYFVAVAEDLNFRRAAERLRVAQPPLSRQIRDLEEELGAPLFERDRGGVRLTDAGRVFLRGARKILDEAGRAVESARAAARGETGELTIGNVSALTFSILPGALAAFRATHPDIDVETREMKRDELGPALSDGRIDLAVATAMAPFRSGTRTLPVFQCPVVVALPLGHRLTKTRKPVYPADIAEEPILFIKPEFAQGYQDWVNAVCRRAGFVPRFTRGTDSKENMVGMIAAGYGICLAPEVVATSMRVKDVVTRKLHGEVPPFTLLAAWTERGHSRLVQEFVRALQAVGNLPAEANGVEMKSLGRRKGVPPKGPPRALRRARAQR